MAADWTVDTDDDFDDEWDDDEVLYLKYVFEGVPTLGALAAALLDLAIVFEERALAGWSLTHPVACGWVSLRPPGG